MNNPFIDAAVKLVEKTMSDVDRKLDEIQQSSEQALTEFDAETLSRNLNIVVSIKYKLLESIKDYDNRFDILKRELGLTNDPMADVYRWDYKRPIIYKIQKADEIIDFHKEFISA